MGAGPEDCLYLNVWTPELPVDDINPGLPVMVWIHGGAFALGNGNPRLCSPYFFIDKRVIVVMINYRLGTFVTSRLFWLLCLDTPALCLSENIPSLFSADVGDYFRILSLSQKLAFSCLSSGWLDTSITRCTRKFWKLVGTQLICYTSDTEVLKRDSDGRCDFSIY
uniref:Carboxylesterase type B domain-containing protein n=1 Tax=Timema tahoe TaxID=61484 RepID=A0A7R9NYF4_9NEOP|nr:unnamed protein product [Timema tahoe]